MNAFLLSRRQLLLSGGAFALSTVAPRLSRAAPHSILRAAPHTSQILPSDWPATPTWAYSAQNPGPVLRIKQGERLRVLLQNDLDQPTTVHWHGLRLPHAMDGVPDVTQAPVQPGETFLYDFIAPDAGTYWYHPHVNSSEQVGRGLHGALIVEEPNPPEVDRDEVWVLDDWRLDRDGAIRNDFQRAMDISHGGRSGNVVTVNGRIPEPLQVRKNERIRLRLINVANARIFGLNFENHDVHVIAIDGQPVTPHTPQYDMVLLAPGQRADVILDCTGEAGSSHRIIDAAYQDDASLLQNIVYDPGAPVRENAPGAVPTLAPNPLAEPDLNNAEHHDITISGGAMGAMQGAIYKGKYLPIDELVQDMRIWALNGVAAHTTAMPPMLNFTLGKSHIITVKNDTVFPHPMHLHGHAFRILSQDGAPVPHTPWADTVLLNGRGTAEIALVADNPGDWLFHCHVLAHVQGGMTSIIRVA
ncbi:multicopper oxidase family protein [Magnetovibrio sp.]|uniref:multicopper oxidase family protein n=1 Tax=Magnetovibrio sp. TaxID=2024836 RepID=UPI002F93721B